MDVEAKRLANLEEELRKDLEAIARVRQIMALKNGSLSRPDDRQMPLPIRVDGILPSSEEDDENAPATSLMGTIDQIVNADPTVRWTNTKMLAHLQFIKFPLRAKKPIYSVGQAMSKLEERGKIRIVKRGAGSAPNVYKGKQIAPVNSEDHSPDEGGSTDADVANVIVREM